MRLVSQSTRATIRTLTILAAVTSLLLTMVNPFLGTARAGHDDPYNAGDGTLDDASFAFVEDPCGNTNQDDQVKGGEKLDDIHLSDPPVIVTSSMTPKDDFCGFWMDSTVDEHGDVWLYAAFTRSTTNGTAHVAIELMDSAATCSTANHATCNPWVNRADGTRIIGFTWQGNSGLIEPTLWTWNGSSFNPGTALGGTVFTGSTGQGGAFGEIAVNLSASDPSILPNIFDTDECSLIAAVIPMTLPGLSLTSQPKDVVLGQFPPIQTCGSIEVVKQVVGGNAFGATFPVTVSNGAINETQNLGHNGSFTVDEAPANDSYTVSEDLTGLTGWSVVSISCTDGSGNEGQTSLSGISVTAGGTTTCTVVNEPDLPELTVVKEVTNSHGGQLNAADFVVDVNGNPVAWDMSTLVIDADGTSSSVSTSNQEVAPGTYVVTEDATAGYELVSITCEGQDTNEVNLALGESATCVVVNRDLPGELILEKVIIDADNLYPAVTEDDFVPTIDGSDADWGTNEVDAGTYTVGEEDANGSSLLADGTFVQTSIECDGQLTDQVTVANGATRTCIITNVAVGSGLMVIKEVQNNWGGTLGAADFPLFVNGDAVASGNALTLPAGSYTIGEEQQDGYELADTFCTRDGDAVDGISGTSFDIDVAPGETVICTFVNRDVPASLTILKDVVNDDGGTATQDDFTPTLDGADTDWGSQDVTIGDQAGLAWGTYTIGEGDLPVGYQMTDISCTDGTTLGDDDSDVDVTLGAGDDVVCTITNDDVAPVVTLTKVVVNDNGGTLTADDFPVTFSGDTVAWGEAFPTTAGSHVAAEVQQPGYVSEGWGGDCAADGSLETEVGGVYECTITNTDVPAGLTLVKVVENDFGGELGPEDFPLLITDGADVTQTVSSGAVTTLPAGTYTIGEVQQENYELLGISCDNGVELVEGEETVTVTVGLNESVVCTITNGDLFVEVQPFEPPPPPPAAPALPVTGVDAARLALWAALLAGLGAMFLLGTSSVPQGARRQ